MTTESADEGLDATDPQKITGIVAQTRADYRGDDPMVIEERLRQRFEQSGITVADAEVARLVAALAAEGSALPPV